MSYEAYCTVEASRQGKLAGESTRKDHVDKMPILRIQYEVHAAVDVSTGKAKGKRAHKPVIITKEWGAASPQLFAACCSNELLKKVEFYFFQKDENGKDEHHYHITLTDAHVIKHRKYTGDALDPSTGMTAKNPGLHDTMELEDISFSFKNITIEAKKWNKIASDNWDENQIT